MNVIRDQGSIQDHIDRLLRIGYEQESERHIGHGRSKQHVIQARIRELDRIVTEYSAAGRRHDAITIRRCVLYLRELLVKMSKSGADAVPWADVRYYCHYTTMTKDLR